MKSKDVGSENRTNADSQIPRVEIPLSAATMEDLKNKKTIKIHLLIPLAQTYLEVLERLQSSWLNTQNTSSQPSDVIPFVVTCAATLECLLNDYMISYSFFVTYGTDSSDRFSKAFLAMPLRGKLDSLLPLLTGNRCILRQDSDTYRQLTRLIKLRNDLMHGKSFAKGYVLSTDPPEPDGMRFPSGMVRLPKLPHQSIGLDQCKGFLRALQALNQLLSSLEKWRDARTIPAEYRNLLDKLSPPIITR